MTGKPARILIIAGSDSSGGAGIQADIKVATALGAYAMTAVTAVTAQDTTAVHRIHAMPAALVRDQILACLDDIGVDAIKTGMLWSSETVKTVADTLSERAPGVPLVVDPVMVSTSGTSLLADEAVAILKARLFPLATLVTPNTLEIERLQVEPKSAFLVKGGHDSDRHDVVDVLVEPSGRMREFVSERIASTNTHGTGCALSTAIACGLGEGMTLEKAIVRARAFVHEAILTAPEFGRGQGPLNFSLRR